MSKKFALFIATVLMLSTVLSACGSNSDSSTNAGNSGSSANAGGTSASEETISGKIEFFSWWTAGGEGQALEALIEGFKKQYPDVEVVNAAVAGGGGVNAKAVLANRMMANDPPSMFQVHGGSELFEWVATGKMESINELYEANGWYDVYPQKVLEMVGKDGEMYGVPMNIHRLNVYYYNKEIFEKHDIQPPATFDEFFAAAEKLKAAGVVPIALGDKSIWTVNVIFDSILLAELGPEDYGKLWTGELPLDHEGVRNAAEKLKKLLSYVNEDHSSLEWQDATQMVIDGKAAMNIMGDWAVGYFINKGWEPNNQFGWATMPETGDYYLVNNDSFGLPKDVDNEQVVLKLLEYMGSDEGQSVFNSIKGSIPARTDVDVSSFNEYLQWSMNDFKKADQNNTLALTMSRGVAVPSGFLTKVEQALTIFVTQQNVDQLIQALKQAGAELK